MPYNQIVEYERLKRVAANKLGDRQRLQRRINLEARPRPTGPCPCVCNSGGFCGGCGHAGCGGRR